MRKFALENSFHYFFLLKKNLLEVDRLFMVIGFRDDFQYVFCILCVNFPEFFPFDQYSLAEFLRRRTAGFFSFHFFFDITKTVNFYSCC